MPISTRPVALVIEETQCLSTVLQDAGWNVLRFSPQQINTGVTSTVSLDIKQNKIERVWIDMPLVGRHIRKERMHSAMNQVCTWLKLASELGVDACLYGAFWPKLEFRTFPDA